jgi:hypothetical protein
MATTREKSAPARAKRLAAQQGVTLRKEDQLPHSTKQGALIAPSTEHQDKLAPAEKRESNVKWIKDKGWQTPLEFMVEVMNDSGQDRGTRLDAAKAAAPYVHAKLQSVMVESPHDQVDSEIKALFRDALAADKAAGPPAPAAEYEPS